MPAQHKRIPHLGLRPERFPVGSGGVGDFGMPFPVAGDYHLLKHPHKGRPKGGHGRNHGHRHDHPQDGNHRAPLLAFHLPQRHRIHHVHQPITSSAAIFPSSMVMIRLA